MYLKSYKYSNLLAAALLLFASTSLLAQVPVADKSSNADAVVQPEVSKEDKGSIDAKTNEGVVSKSSIAEFQKTQRFTSPETPIASPRAAKQTASSEWQFAVTPYLYMTGLNGTVGARGALTDIDVSFGDVVSNLRLGLMGTVEARKNRFVFVNDLIWIRLKGDERETPGGLFSTVAARVNMVVWDPELGYRVYESEKGSLDILGGFRLTSVENLLIFGTGTQPGFTASQRKTWAMPVGGVHGLMNLSEKMFISGKFDLGGWGDNFTTQVYLGGGYRIKPKIALIGGYRYLKTDYSDNSGFVFDTTMNGIVFGAKFQL